jgi:hypothetical protein
VALTTERCGRVGCPVGQPHAPIAQFSAPRIVWQMYDVSWLPCLLHSEERVPRTCRANAGRPSHRWKNRTTWLLAPTTGHELLRQLPTSAVTCQTHRRPVILVLRGKVVQ